jgi:predicted ATPase with chaperone activity
MVSRHQKRIRRPLLDRFDIHIEVPPGAYEELVIEQADDSSEAVK